MAIVKALKQTPLRLPAVLLMVLLLHAHPLVVAAQAEESAPVELVLPDEFPGEWQARHGNVLAAVILIPGKTDRLVLHPSAASEAGLGAALARLGAVRVRNSDSERPVLVVITTATEAVERPGGRGLGAVLAALRASPRAHVAGVGTARVFRYSAHGST